MKLVIYSLISAFFITLNSFAALAQDSTKKAATQKPGIIAKPASPSVPRTSLWTQLQIAKDSLSSERNKTLQLQKKITDQNTIVTALQDSLKAKSAEEAEALATPVRNDVDFLGSSLPFSTYNAIVLGALLFFALAFAFVLFRSGKYRNEAQYRIGLYKDLSDEYQAHKVKANEKEKKLARELQDERNKLEELKGR